MRVSIKTREGFLGVVANMVRQGVAGWFIVVLFTRGVTADEWQPTVPRDQLPSVKELPDVLAHEDGRRIQTAAQWMARRAGIQAMIQHYQYGKLPPRPDGVSIKDHTQEEYHGDLGVAERFTLVIGGTRPLEMHVALHRPASPNGTSPKPVVISNVHAISDLPCIPQYLESGFVLVQYEREDLDPDKSGVVGPAQAAYPDHDWATLAVWAWGGMRVVDYLETRDDIDQRYVAITGHSRGGKAALLAGALDERFTLVAPNGSGCGGGGCYRDTPETAESLAKITDPKRFHYWFQEDFGWFSDREDRLPFDQHFVKALVAPRALLCTEARGDAWANPPGTRRTSEACNRVFALFDATEKNGLAYREGRHDQNDEDWHSLLTFAKWHFLGQRPENPAEFWEEP